MEDIQGAEENSSFFGAGNFSPSLAADDINSTQLDNNSTNLTWTISSNNTSDDWVFIGLTSSILGVLILCTIIGNVFVIAAILLERHLHSVANYLIVSLAVADLLVACLVMPLGAVYEISQKWILGPELCDMWTSSDVLCCTASILHLVAIAVDRYWAVTNVEYIQNRNAKRICVMIFLVWAVAIIVSLAPLFGWKDPDFIHRVNIQQRCLVSQDVAYQVFATCATFYVPLTVILILYWKIFQTARRRIRRKPGLVSDKAKEKRSWLKLGKLPDKAGAKKARTEDMQTIPSVIKTNGSDCEPSATAFTIQTAQQLQPPIKELPQFNGTELVVTPSEDQATASSPSKLAPTCSTRVPRKRRETLESKREKKAAKTLAIITGAFVVCWLPFFVCALLLPLCASCEITDAMLSVILWLGYLNSTLNPVIYTIFSPEFRQAFKRLLCGKKAGQPSTGRQRKPQ